MVSENHKTVLVIDDESTCLELIDFVLQKHHYRTVLTSRPDEAIQLARHHAPDLIILDLVMPEMRGTELCERLKSDPSTQNIPVLFLSATVSEKDIEAGFKSGAEGYIFKPFEPDKIIEKIDKVIHRHAR